MPDRGMPELGILHLGEESFALSESLLASSNLAGAGEILRGFCSAAFSGELFSAILYMVGDFIPDG